MSLTLEQAAKLRTLLDRRIVAHPHPCTNGANLLYEITAGFARDIDCERDLGMQYEIQAVLAEHWWDLARAGIIALVGSDASGFSSAWFTASGRRVLSVQEPSPHDESAYLGAIRKRVANPDPVVMAYIVEAAAAWRVQLNKSSVVMLGCACERLIIMLAEEISKKNVPPFSANLAKALGPITPIAKVFELCRDALDTQPLPRDLQDGLDRKLVPIFERTRILRNKSGHPSGQPVEPEEAHAGLLLVPSFYQYVHDLIEHVGTWP
jgi:hypothetical protein